MTPATARATQLARTHLSRVPDTFRRAWAEGRDGWAQAEWACVLACRALAEDLGDTAALEELADLRLVTVR